MNARNSNRNGITRQRGFTLMELIVVMVVLGILVAIAIPNYSEYIRRGHRTAAQEYLASLAARQVQFYLDRRAFTNNVADLNLATPAEVASRYTFAIVANAGPPASFTITASPTGTQTGDRCGDMTIDQTGARGAAATRCW